jgi:hypothetical protein
MPEKQQVPPLGLKSSVGMTKKGERETAQLKATPLQSRLRLSFLTNCLVAPLRSKTPPE